MTDLKRKNDLLCELSTALHKFGVPAHRLEVVTQSVGDRLGLDDVQVFAVPTSLQIYTREKEETEFRMVRISPSGIHLDRLRNLDQAISQIADGELNLMRGLRKVRSIVKAPAKFGFWTTVSAYPMTGTGLAVLLGATWSTLVVGVFLSLLVGLIFEGLKDSQRFSPVIEVLASLTVGFFAYFAATIFDNIAIAKVIITSIIVLVPGLGITTAVMELATQNLVSGTARLTGGVTTLLKLFFGAAAGGHIASTLFVLNSAPVVSDVPDLMIAPALAVISFSFVILFQLRMRDFFLVFATCSLVWTSQYLGNIWISGLYSNFFAAFLLGVFSNAVGRLANLPVSSISLPGLILLVPGSLGYSSLISLGQNDVITGINSAFQVFQVAGMIVGGLLMAQFVVSPKRVL